MKTLIRNLFIILGTSAVVLSSGCIKKDFDVPPVIIPKVDFDANTTIAQLKAMYTGQLDSLDTDIIIQGIVIANDESGNYYKTLVIRDNTAGIEVKLDQTDLYIEYRLGQRIFIKCQGLYLGDYGGLVQLGYIYEGAIGRIPQIWITDHIFRDSLPGPAPVPVLKSIPQFSSADLNTLIKLDSVHFDEVGEQYAPQTDEATNRTIIDEQDNTLILRTSRYASFASALLPKGKGPVTGILSIYNGDYQLYIRDLNDVQLDPSLAPLFEENFSTNPNWQTFSVASNENWEWDDATQSMSVNGYAGDTPSDDWLFSPAISLANATNPVLTFKTWTRFTDTGMPEPLTVHISTDYAGSGDPSTATWTKLNPTLSPTNSETWTPSGSIDLSAYIFSTVYVAFQYRSSGTGASTSSSWSVDSFEITDGQ